MGVLGFDLGATAALVVASQRALGAAVTVAAAGVQVPLADGLPALLDVVGELTCPWLGLYGETGDWVVWGSLLVTTLALVTTIATTRRREGARRL